MRRLKGYFITGLLVVVPLYITAYVILLIVGFVDNAVNILPAALRPDTYFGHIPGMGLAFTLAGIFLAGALASNFAGKRLLLLGEKILARIPVMRMLYNGTKQFMETFFSKGDGQGFRKVVLLEFPRKGVYSIGFITSRTRGEIKTLTGDGMVNVFLPTTPNPTSGFFMVAPEKEVIYLDMKVEDAFKVIMTGGIVVPDTDTLKQGGAPGVAKIKAVEK